VAEKRLTGYRRADGRVGIRNHVLILPVDDLSNAAAESVARAIPGTLALPHPYGRLQFGADLDLFFQTMIGTGANPNVAGVVVIGIEPTWTERIASGIAETGKPVAQFSIERHGDLRILELAGRRAAQLLQDASELTRVPVERGELMMSIKCGESDTTSGLGANPATSEAVDRHIAAGGTVIFGETTELTGGEHLIAERCASDEVRKKFQGFFDDYFALVERTGANLLGSQPTQGNIRGGLSTIEEKALATSRRPGPRPWWTRWPRPSGPPGPGSTSWTPPARACSWPRPTRVSGPCSASPGCGRWVWRNCSRCARCSRCPPRAGRPPRPARSSWPA
jgi:(2R)-sulfolactate sulfo-lyase subunit beta